MSIPSSKTINLGFLAEDIRNQIMHSRSIAEQVDKIREIAAATENQAEKQQLEQIANALITTANGLASNAETTTTTAANTVTFFYRSST